MKQAEILKILAKDLKCPRAELTEINKSLKAKDAPKIKYRLAGKKIGHYGFTGLLKALTTDGVKVYDVNKVTLIPYDAIEKMDIAKPREKRVAPAKPAEPKVSKAPVKPPEPKAGKAPVKKSATAQLEVEDEDDDDDDLDGDDFDDDDFVIPKKRKRPRPTPGQNGSKYIPKKK
jgi:hypothetical protein